MSPAFCCKQTGVGESHKFPKWEKPECSSVGIELTCAVDIESNAKTVLKIITRNDPFFCFPALKIIYLPFLVQAQCRSELRLPLNKAALSWWHRTPQAVRVAFPRLVFPFPTLLQQAGCEPCALQPCGVVGQAGRACCGETGEGNLAGEEKESSA